MPLHSDAKAYADRVNRWAAAIQNGQAKHGITMLWPVAVSQAVRALSRLPDFDNPQTIEIG